MFPFTHSAALYLLLIEGRETGIGSDVIKPIAARIVGGMIISRIHVLILVPVFFAVIKGRHSATASYVWAPAIRLQRSETGHLRFKAVLGQLDKWRR
jgi:hypothetical protein